MKYIVTVIGLTGTRIIKSNHRTQIGAMDSAERLLKLNPACRPFIYQGILKVSRRDNG